MKGEIIKQERKKINGKMVTVVTVEGGEFRISLFDKDIRSVVFFKENSVRADASYKIESSLNGIVSDINLGLIRG